MFLVILNAIIKHCMKGNNFAIELATLCQAIWINQNTRIFGDCKMALE